MFIFNSCFTANSKKTNEPFYSVKLFERREGQDKTLFFKDVSAFVSKDVYDKIVKAGFKFGDTVEIETSPARFFGASEELIGLKLVKESPFFD